MTILRTIQQSLHRNGLRVCGAFPIAADDDLPLPRGSVILVGQITEGWAQFAASAEYSDGQANPLDRYSQRICQTIADDYQGQVIMPSDGPPFYPFQRWAQRAEAVTPSMIGLLLHPEFGLWHAYRAAIVLPQQLSGSTVNKTQPENTCQTCHRPCLSACPVQAFSLNGYDVVACKTYLKTLNDAPCHTQGCLARTACPVGKAHEYQPRHKHFLMRAFSPPSINI